MSPAHPAAIDVGGKPYLRDAKGALVPIATVKPTDLLMDELVRSILVEAVELSATIGAGPAATIFGAFTDLEPIIYTQAGAVLEPISAIRSDVPAPTFQGPGSTLHRVTYEVQMLDLPERPANGETFSHRGRTWRVSQVEDLLEVRSWLLTVTDAGALR